MMSDKAEPIYTEGKKYFFSLTTGKSFIGIIQTLSDLELLLKDASYIFPAEYADKIMLSGETPKGPPIHSRLILRRSEITLALPM